VGLDRGVENAAGTACGMKGDGCDYLKMVIAADEGNTPFGSVLGRGLRDRSWSC
jgi:hypothetical protein